MIEHLIEIIIGIVIFIVSTEIIFFNTSWKIFDTFFPRKMISIFGGILSTIILFVIPFLTANIPQGNKTEAYGNIFYVWYYGAIIFILILFGINYLIFKKIEKNKEEEE